MPGVPRALFRSTSNTFLTTSTLMSCLAVSTTSSARSLKSLADFQGNKEALVGSKPHVEAFGQRLSATPHLPPRAPSVSIPAFVHLLFSPYCHVSVLLLSTSWPAADFGWQVCGVAVVQRVIWAWHMRWCAQCFPTVYVQRPHSKSYRR